MWEERHNPLRKFKSAKIRRSLGFQAHFTPRRDSKSAKATCVHVDMTQCEVQAIAGQN